MLREAVTRLSTQRFAWVWLLLEPIFHIAYLMVLFAVIRMRVIGGIDVALWIMLGLVTFFMFRNTSIQSMHAIKANSALFVYRQVKPVDCILVRSVLEAVIVLVFSSLILMVIGLMGINILPRDPLLILAALGGVWLIGVGFGLITSALSELVPEMAKIINMFMAPLYILSGVVFPLGQMPQPYRGWLLLNPLAHGVELTRLGFSSYYQAVPELSLLYVYQAALCLIFLGLLLQIRYASQLVAQ